MPTEDRAHVEAFHRLFTVFLTACPAEQARCSWTLEKDGPNLWTHPDCLKAFVAWARQQGHFSAEQATWWRTAMRSVENQAHNRQQWSGRHDG